MISLIITISLIILLLFGVGLFLWAFILHKTLVLLWTTNSSYIKALKIQTVIWLIWWTAWLMIWNWFSQWSANFLLSLTISLVLIFFFIALVFRKYYNYDLWSTVVIYIVYTFLYIAVNFIVWLPFIKYIWYFEITHLDRMEPTINETDVFFTDKLYYKRHPPQRWDIIKLNNTIKQNTFLWRIIGMPWETVKIHDWYIEICNSDEFKKRTKDKNCTRLNEQQYLTKSISTQVECEQQDKQENSNIWEYILSNWYFILSDKRQNSTDSRCCFGLNCNERDNYEIYYEDIVWKISFSVYPKFKVY